MNRRGLLFGLFATSALVSVPTALALTAPRETIEKLLARRLSAAEKAIDEILARQLSDMLYGDDSPPMTGGLAELLDIKSGDISLDDWDEEDGEAAYVRYS